MTLQHTRSFETRKCSVIATFTLGSKGRSQSLGVVTKRLGACFGFDGRDRSLAGKAGN